MNDLYPNVKTTVRVGKLTIEIFAYRLLTQNECKTAIAQYLKQTRQKILPTSGILQIHSIIGIDPLDF